MLQFLFLHIFVVCENLALWIMHLCFSHENALSKWVVKVIYKWANGMYFTSFVIKEVLKVRTFPSFCGFCVI